MSEDLMSLTLDQLEGDVWPDPDTGWTPLVRNVYRLRKIPIGKFEPADFCVLLSQQLSIKYLVPSAIEILESQPLIESQYYEGDLLVATMRIPDNYWSEDPEQLRQLRRIAKTAELEVTRQVRNPTDEEELAWQDCLPVDEELLQDIRAFLAKHNDGVQPLP